MILALMQHCILFLIYSYLIYLDLGFHVFSSVAILLSYACHNVCWCVLFSSSQLLK